jgi:hypothetical protein
LARAVVRTEEATMRGVLFVLASTVIAARQSSGEPQIARAQTVECRSVGADDIGAQYLGRRDQPGIVLAEAARRASLEDCAPSGVCNVEPLDRKPFEGRHRARLVRCALEDLGDRNDGNDQAAVAKLGQKQLRRTDSACRRLAFESD